MPANSTRWHSLRPCALPRQKASPIRALSGAKAQSRKARRRELAYLQCLRAGMSTGQVFEVKKSLRKSGESLRIKQDCLIV